MTDLSKLDEAAFNSEVTKHLPSLDSLPQHRMTKAKAIEIAKCDLLFNGLGWELTSEKGDYKAYKLQLKGMTYPFVKGENIFIGETIERISTWIQSTKRDKRMDQLIFADHLPDGSTLVQARQKGAMMIASRWMNLYVTEQSEGENAIIFSTESVEDAKFPPPSGGSVVGYTFSAWKLEKVSNGVKTTRIAYVDPKGSLNSSIFKIVLSDLTESVEIVKDALKKHGPNCCTLYNVPYNVQNVHFSDRDYDLDAIKLVLKVSDGKSGKVWFCCPPQFKSGFHITTSGNVQISVVNGHNCGDLGVFLAEITGSEMITIEGKAGKGLLWNGKEIK